MRIILIVICIFPTLLIAEEDLLLLNMQFHYDIRRDHPTVTQEVYATDKLGFTFFFMDVNFDRYRKKGGVSDFYFEFMRYFKLASWKTKDINITIQYDDGSDPIKQVWLVGLNLSNINYGPFNMSTEFLLKKEYKLNVNWQYTFVWYAEFLQGKLIFNGFFDYWINDVKNSNWPAFDPEFARTKYSFQAEPQIGWLFTPHWKVGSEIEIGKGFLGSVTGKLAQEQSYKYDRWYFMPTLFIQYNF